MDDRTRAQLDDPALLDANALERVHELADLGELHPAWTSIRTDWLDVAGTRARLLRRDGAPDGPTVVLVHGLGGGATNWLPVMHGLASIGDVVAVDLPGFGETAPARPGAARPRNNARWLATVLHALDAGPVVLVGNSMGGLIATFVAGGHPELIANLVLLCPAIPQHLAATRVSRIHVSGFGPMLVPVLGRRIVRRRLQRMSFEQRYDALMDEIVSDPSLVTHAQRQVGIANLARVRELRWRNRAYREASAGIMDVQLGAGRAAVVAAMRAVRAPTLYVRGALDRLVLHGTTVMVRRTRPDWIVEEPTHVGHVPMLEDPAWTVERLAQAVAGDSVAVAG